jgi:hypothetical protein
MVEKGKRGTQQYKGYVLHVAGASLYTETCFAKFSAKGSTCLPSAMQHDRHLRQRRIL